MDKQRQDAEASLQDQRREADERQVAHDERVSQLKYRCQTHARAPLLSHLNVPAHCCVCSLSLLRRDHISKLEAQVLHLRETESAARARHREQLQVCVVSAATQRVSRYTPNSALLVCAHPSTGCECTAGRCLGFGGPGWSSF